MNDREPTLTAVSEEERAEAMARFRILQPFLENGVPLSRVASENGIPIRTARRWAKQYGEAGLVGLIRRRRADRGKRTIPAALQHLIEGLALQKPTPTTAMIHRQVSVMADQQGWGRPSYATVYRLSTASATTRSGVLLSVPK